MSDQPGHDRQKSTAFAINSYWQKSNVVSVNTILTTNRTNAEYGYDEDWTGPEFQPGYQAFDNYYVILPETLPKFVGFLALRVKYLE